MKKLFKKPLAIVIALAIVLTSISVAVFATTDVDFTIITKFETATATDSDGNSVLYAKAGDKLVADIYLGSKNAYVTTATMLFTYDNDVLELDSDHYGAKKVTNFLKNNTASLTVDCENENFAATMMNGEGFRTTYFNDGTKNGLRIQNDAANTYVAKYSEDAVLCKIYFTVKQDVEATDEGIFQFVESSINVNPSAFTVTYKDSYDGEAASDVETADKIMLPGTSGYEAKLTKDSKYAIVKFSGDVIWDAGAGDFSDAFKNTNSANITDKKYTAKDFNGANVSTILAETDVTAPSGSYFKGWSLDGTIVATDDEIKAVTFANGTDTKTIIALYAELGTVVYKAGDHGTFADGSHDDTNAKTYTQKGKSTDTVTKLTEANVIADTGYVFIGWSADDTNVKFVDGEEVTFTAQYAELGKVIYKAGDHGTFADGSHDAGDNKTFTQQGKESETVRKLTTTDVVPETGYVFTGWAPVDTDAKFENNSVKTFVAQYELADVSATIEVYEMGVDGNYPATATKTKTAGYKYNKELTQADALAEAGYEVKDGFQVDDEVGKNVASVILTSIDTPTTYKIYIERKQYKLTYAIPSGESLPNGVDEYTEELYYYDAPVTLKNVYEKNNEDVPFTAWDQDITKMPAKDVTVTAQHGDPITIAYQDKNGNAITGLTPATIYGGQTLTLPEIPGKSSKDGYNYDYTWTVTDGTTNTEGIAEGGTFKVNALATTVTAKVVETVTPKSVSVSADGTLVDDFGYNAKVTGLPATEDGFLGWYVDGKEFDLDKTIEENLGEYAERINLVPHYGVVDRFFVPYVEIENAGTENAKAVLKFAETAKATYDTDITAYDPATAEAYEVPSGDDVTITGFEFQGWTQTKYTDYETSEIDETQPDGKFDEKSRDFYAVYTIKEYTIKFVDENGDLIPGSETVAIFGSALPAAATPLADKSAKEVWNQWVDQDGKPYGSYSEVPAYDVTFSPTWKFVEVKYTWMSTDFWGNEYQYEVTTNTVGENVVYPETEPTKFGMKFVGWADENGNAPVSPIPDETEKTYYAQFQIDETFVGIVVGGTVVAGTAIAAATAANAALITGAAAAVIIGGVIVAKHTYTVTYMVDGEVYKTYKVIEGTNVLTPKDPTKAGYVFKGWDNLPEKMPANDITVEAVWGAEDEIPATGSATVSLAALAAISSAAAAAYVLSKRKKEDED